MPKFLLSIVLLTSLLFNTCSTKKVSKDTWLVGKIDNPMQDHVLLLHNHILIDTVKLDSENFFRYQFNDSIKEGMYSFKHESTHPFYISPGDSLLLIANTLDFDYSLFYSNDHAAENNFIQLLAKHLKYENFYWSELHKYNSTEFDKELFERNIVMNQLLADFQKDNPNTSQSFIRIAKGAIEHESLLNRERFIQAHFSNDYGIDKQIPESFYKHREKINFDANSMEVFLPYYSMLDTYLDNLVLNSLNRKELFSRSDYELNKYKLELIDSLVTNQEIKNTLLYSTTRNFLLHTKSSENQEKLFSEYNRISSCPIRKAYLNSLKSYTSHIKTGSKVPDTKLITIDNTEVNLSSIISKPTLVFFWSYKDIRHQKNIHIRVKELEAKFPEYQYIGINIDDHFKTWRAEVNKLAYIKDAEFQLHNAFEGKKDLVISMKNKILILDENAIILNGHINIFHPNIENELLQYLNM